jgi:hypothetical protein
LECKTICRLFHSRDQYEHKCSTYSLPKMCNCLLSEHILLSSTKAHIIAKHIFMSNFQKIFTDHRMNFEESKYISTLK